MRARRLSRASLKSHRDSGGLRRQTDTERMSEWRNETSVPKGALASPLLHGPAGPQDWLDASVTSGRLVEENPFALSACPLSLPDSSNPSRASIIVSYDYSPSPPLYRESPSYRSRRDNGMEPIRWIRRTCACDWLAQFLIIISTRRYTILKGDL